jgi:hypothetical protein
LIQLGGRHLIHAGSRHGNCALILDLVSFHPDSQNPEALELEGGAQFERYVRKLLPQDVAVEPVVLGVNGQAAGDDVLKFSGRLFAVD